MSDPIVYLDNNATTAMCKTAIDEMESWLAQPANPSSTSSFGTHARKMIENSRKFIVNHCHAQNYTVVFTSGASESNCFIIRATVEAYKRQKNVKPHVLTGLNEHKSIIKCCEALKAAGLAEITYLTPGASGCIPVGLVTAGIRDNTCIISIMAANNELGCINNIKAIGEIAHSHSIPFHSDFVQVFGKYRINLPEYNIDAISASFHKLYGPKGSGILVINNDLITGYDLTGQISGTQEFGLRGGTENVAAIAGSIAALKHTFTNRAAKNTKLFAQRDYLLTKLRSKFPIKTYREYFMAHASTSIHSQKGDPAAVANTATKKRLSPGPGAGVYLVILGPDCDSKSQTSTTASQLPQILPNTLMIAIIRSGNVPFCNVKLKAALEKENVIVSIGSACNTASKDASHVLDSIKASDEIKSGTIRISMCDTTSKKELDRFISEFTSAIKAQVEK
jgi:cysteine desulfurase